MPLEILDTGQWEKHEVIQTNGKTQEWYIIRDHEGTALFCIVRDPNRELHVTTKNEMLALLSKQITE